MSKCALVVLLFCLSGNQASIPVQHEIFSGRLIYKIDHFDDISDLPGEIKLILAPNYNVEILVKDDLLLHRTYNEELGIYHAGYQNKDTAFLYGENERKIDFSQIPGDLSQISQVKKTREIKTILGLPCTKYVYLSDGNIFTVWIPKNKPYSFQRSYGRFFNNFFYPDGLAFEINMSLSTEPDNILVTKRLIRMELFDPTEEKIRNFQEEIKTIRF